VGGVPGAEMQTQQQPRDERRASTLCVGRPGLCARSYLSCVTCPCTNACVVLACGGTQVGLLGWLRARPYQRRVVTAILYLNEPDWDVGAHGGKAMLR